MSGKGGIDDVGGVADTIASPVGKVTTRPLISLTWTKTSSTLGLGTITSSPPQGGLNADGHTGQDPDQFVGSFTIAPSAPTLGLGTIVSPTGKGDVGDVYGSPDLSSQDPNVSGLIAWDMTTPTLSVGTNSGSGGGTLTVLTPKGIIPDPDTWNNGGPALGVGTISSSGGKGDIEGDYRNGTAGAEGRWFIATWAPETPTLGLGTIAPVTGKGPITDPYAWEDAIFFLTSQPYPIVVVEGTAQSGISQGGSINQQPQYAYEEGFSDVAAITSGALILGLITYTNGLPDGFSDVAAITSGALILGLITYTNGLPEGFSDVAAITSGTLTLGLIQYTNWPAEGIKDTAAITGGTLS